MSCLFVCHPHLTSIIVLTAVWAQACGLKHKTPFVIIVHSWIICLRGSVSVCGGSSSTILPLLVQVIRIFATATIFGLLVCWWTVHSISVLFFLYKVLRRKIHSWLRSPVWDETMARQWERVDEDKAVGPRFGQDPPPSFSAPTPAYTYRQWKCDLRLWLATSSLQKNRQGRWLLRPLNGGSRTAAEVVMDDALIQDGGIDSIVGDLDRCWEVTQDQDQRRLRRPSWRLRGGTSKRKPPSCPTWRGGNSIFNSWKVLWVRYCQQWSPATQHYEAQNEQKAATIRW